MAVGAKIVAYFRNIDDGLRRVVRDTIRQTFLLEYEERELGSDIGFAYVPRRGQYDAEKLLDWALERLERIFLVILEDDIYVRGLNFVFGVALPYAGAVISIYRFLAEPPYVAGESPETRLYKTVKHELGHVFGLSHCSNPCVMRFANSVLELDLKPSEFCPICAARLKSIGVLRHP